MVVAVGVETNERKRPRYPVLLSVTAGIAYIRNLHGYSSDCIAVDPLVRLDAERADTISCCAVGIPQLYCLVSPTTHAVFAIN